MKGERRVTCYLNVIGAAVALAALLMWPSVQAATNRFVATTGNDASNDCSNSATPCRTIQHAIAQATAGDTIQVAAGTYMENVTVSKNVTIQGAGAGLTIVDGNASGRVFLFNGVTATLERLTITNGHAADSGGPLTGQGGGIRNQASHLTLTNCTVSGNSADLFGGGIYNSSVLTVINSTVLDNSADDSGGGIFNTHTLTVTNSTLSSNSASFNGGGIFDSGGRVEITNSTVAHNSADDFGGGIANSGELTVTNSTLSSNSAEGGGGIYNAFMVILTNSTLSGNSANTGGGIYNDGQLPHRTRITITNSTVADNSALTGAGIANIGELIIKNSIVANDCAFSAASTLTTLGKNFSTGICFGFDLVTSAQLNLGPLQNNGGPTATHALLAGSVAIDAATDCADGGGNTITDDQRGVMRPIDGDGDGTPECDVGAYEAPVCISGDSMPPQITCPMNRTIGTQAPNCSARATYVATATDNCPGVSVTCTPPSGSTFALGTTTVSCKATDAGGNMATCTFTVTVVDDDGPQITCPPNQTVQAGANCQATVSVGTATATDNCTPSGSITITGTRSDGQPLTAP
ncbi:MAG: pectinesterase family protein, partial [Blastocatellia bacterium]|nr:pectinesterase family protein [Blastocatellia bacterium]